MKCPECGSIRSAVIDSRHTPDGNSVRRRRECKHCSHRFTTYESIPRKTTMTVTDYNRISRVLKDVLEVLKDLDIKD